MGNGVMDSVGAHVWEAALLLCAELSSSRYQHYVEDSAALELGSGVGLTGLYFLQLKLKLLSHPGSSSGSSSGSVCLSDYDHQVLRNLAACVRGLHAVSADTTTITTPHDNRVGAATAAAAINAEKREASVTGKVAKLDWFDVDSSRLQLGAIDFAFGAACIYNGEQAEALSNLCFDLLCIEGGQCQEVVLVQVRDRPGFEQFLALLGQRGVLHEVETVAEAVYQHAASHITSSSRRRGSDEDEDEDGDGFVCRERVLTIPSMVGGGGGGGGSAAAPGGGKDRLLRTAREAFVRVLMRRATR
jgi:hypothetical protein